jgi:hypothetical protein
MKLMTTQIFKHEGSPSLQVQAFVMYGLHATAQCHLHVLVYWVEQI